MASTTRGNSLRLPGTKMTALDTFRRRFYVVLLSKVAPVEKQNTDDIN